MAPRQRKGDKSPQKKSDEKKSDDAAPPTEEEDAPFLVKKFPWLKPYVVQIQLLIMFLVAGASVVPLILNPPDKTRLIDSYRAPQLWYDQFAKDYAEMADQWGYTLHKEMALKLQAAHAEVGVKSSDVQILDVGAGVGSLGSELKRLGYPALKGIDASTGMANEARAIDGGAAYEVVNVSDAEALPMNLSNASVDAVLCVGTAGYLARGEYGAERDDQRMLFGGLQPDRSRVRALLLDWLRVVRPGGIVGLTVEATLAEAWEAEQLELVKEGLWRAMRNESFQLWPKHQDWQLKAENVTAYFYQKTPEEKPSSFWR
eukprot:TRINITY_DN15033_c2_g1_i1.p1 TRINITY_DN15033_c2_g1~~TRINITY_DN15033_c2_g1_i1.p1  ORF type:complete len:316 (-),score=85.58 TRINITY_DN15033_c2_g1_i1:100-1047(-)